MKNSNPKDEISFENAHPNAQKLMQDDFFYSPIEETAPFGSDDGWETFYAFRDWLQVNNKRNKVDFINEQIEYWGYPTFNLQSIDIVELEGYLKNSELGSRFMSGIDQAIVATAFGQLYLQGFMDLNLRSLAITAVRRQLLPDILSLWEEHKDKRETKLNKLLAVLSPS
ncbi:hypothetical protein QTN47_21345 [Danxiaibacter flavus]|uniref:Uncharacterized protein n=1 Tax=Danxiaibacter flavus TaxID=3049108 RepID=A0ABV3ZJR7_9BACT|nr:hypothetical protein QNM32_21350 [Chitinophagaceae bacterium DXS]